MGQAAPGGPGRRPARSTPRRADRAPPPSWRRRPARTWSLSASAVSNTASVPSTLTFAPRSGLALQVGRLQARQVKDVRRPDPLGGRPERRRGRIRLPRMKWTDDFCSGSRSSRGDECLPSGHRSRPLVPLDELLGHPGTDAAVAARHQYPHVVSPPSEIVVGNRTRTNITDPQWPVQVAPLARERRSRRRCDLLTRGHEIAMMQVNR